MVNCVEPDHFQIINGAVLPQPWMQWRRVVSGEAASVERSFPPTGGGNKNELLQSIRLSWTNDSPIYQYVYGMVTRGGVRMTFQARTRAYLVSSHGYDVGSLTMYDVSKVGTGMTLGKEGLFANNQFGVSECRQNSRTVPLLPTYTGWFQLAPGLTVSAGFDLRFISDFWESETIDGGLTGTEASLVTGGSRVDLYAIPFIP